MAKAKKGSAAALQFAFFKHLWGYYTQHRKWHRANYKGLIKRFLDYNDPGPDPYKPRAFLRRPQFEALEMYVFIKERLDNKPVHDIFDAWYHRKPPFQNRGAIGLEVDDQGTLFDRFDERAYKEVFARLRKASEGASYSNFIFALTMGTGKTILMATTIFLDFLLAKTYPRDKRYAHNALVFAPDTTVLQSLREIQTFDRTKVVPPDYARQLDALITFHFLEDTGTTLNVLEGSRYNVIISNTQKIILKRKSSSQGPLERLLNSGKPGYQRSSGFGVGDDLYQFDDLDEKELSTNQRFEKLRRLRGLAIYVDEAHHAFGNNLEKDLSRTSRSKTSLRLTIDELSIEAHKAGHPVVACYNFTGTPYSKGNIFPEVVYAYGLRDAIDNAYLKKVRIRSYSNSRTEDFVHDVVADFFRRHPADARFEGMRPKLAIFATNIAELRDELRPLVEEALVACNRPTSTIVVNTGDKKLTTNDDLREFNRLDTVDSEKQVILLVNKGKEGWNCRSLFGVALYRKPKSKVFVLQASMRCLRAIDHPPQRTGSIYLSKENEEILDAELNQNFRVGLSQVKAAGTKGVAYEVRPSPPPVKVSISRVRRMWQMTDRTPGPGLKFDLEALDLSRYQATVEEQEGLTFEEARRGQRRQVAMVSVRHRRTFSALTLTGEVARYLNKSPVFLERILRESHEGMDAILEVVNQYNEVLYDCIIPKLFKALYNVRRYQNEELDEVLLVKEPPANPGYYRVHAAEDKVIREKDRPVRRVADKSFHLDTYCFDSNPEQKFFLDVLKHEDVDKVYFTGMLTHGQSEFFIQYIDPDSKAVRTYYPDFYVVMKNGRRYIIEVKGDHMIDSPEVRAKADAARQISDASRIEYRIISGKAVMAGQSAEVFGTTELIR